VCSAVGAPIVSHFIAGSFQAADKFPEVDNYSCRWPVTDLMKMHLKNTSSKHRKLEYKVAAGRADSAKPTKKLQSKNKSGGRKVKVRDFLSYI
jgi:hypothetical protein